jgi:hypothetical protein
MKRHLIAALAIAMAAAGCSAERTPAGTSADAAPPPAVDTGVRAANEAPALPVDEVPAADAITVPARFVGEWAIDAAACAGPGHESQLRIGADRIAFHESSGAIQSVASGDSDLTVVAQLTGEGETREATYRFRLSGDGNTLTDIGTGMGMVRRRCD